MNLVLSFLHPSKPARELGPFHSVSIDAQTVRDAASERVLARHRNHQWELEGERYFRLDTKSKVCIQFERAALPGDASARSREFGPFTRFSAVDGIAFTDERVFAFMDARAGDWFCYVDGRRWALMVVSDATARSKSDLWAMLAGLTPQLPGVIGLWQELKLVYIGRAACLRSRIEFLADRFDPSLVSAITWETHPDPAVREAELHAEYASASPALASTYGWLHGNRVRTSRLIEVARRTRQRAQAARNAARGIRGRAAEAA